MKGKRLIIALMVASSLLVGCGNNNTDNTKNNTPITNETTENGNITSGEDAITSASRATDEATLKKAASKEGSWIIIIQQDLTCENDVTVEGEFTKADKTDPSKEVPAGRKIALYDQNDNKEITANYTLTVPKLIIKSKDTTIKGGKIIGDIEVEEENFSLQDTTIEGNVYFKDEKVKDSFTLGENAKVTGETKVK